MTTPTDNVSNAINTQANTNHKLHFPAGTLCDTYNARLFEQLYKDGQTIILVTHEHDIAAHARRQIHLKDGTVERDVATLERS